MVHIVPPCIGASDVIGSIAHEVIRDSAANVGFPCKTFREFLADLTRRQVKYSVLDPKS